MSCGSSPFTQQLLHQFVRLGQDIYAVRGGPNFESFLGSESDFHLCNTIEIMAYFFIYPLYNKSPQGQDLYVHINKYNFPTDDVYCRIIYAESNFHDFDVG